MRTLNSRGPTWARAIVIAVAAAGIVASVSEAQGRGGRGGRGGGQGAPEQRQPGGKRAIRVDDLFNLRTVRDVQISPDGEWVAYVVATLDSVRDRGNSDIFMARWDGSRTTQLTYTPEAESAPRFSPDGKYLSFVATRGESRQGSQIWLLDRSGGEAQKLTDHRGGISDYQWSPDSKRIVFASMDPDSATLPPPPGADTSRAKTAKPIVVDRYAFKQDGQGYLGPRRTHLYVFDVERRRTAQLTSGRYSETNLSLSPDGRFVAFVSERAAPDPDRVNDSNIYMMETRAGSDVRQLTTWKGPDEGRPAWSPDGKWIAYLQGSEPEYGAYNLNKLAVVAIEGGEPRVLTAALDRPVSQPRWSADGASILVLVTDDRAVHPARVSVQTGAVTRLIEGRRVIADVAVAPGGRMAMLAGQANRPNEVHAFENGGLRAISHENDRWLADVALSTTEDFSAKGKDGTVVNGLLVKPAGFDASKKYPALLRIHGGPNGQDAHSFNLERELFAANGYLVIAANYRGSSGRGADFQRAIYADWGNKEVQDLLAAVDHVVALGIADSTRLGIGGWSYGGILTNYTIATTTRFRAATSGAGSSLQTSLYGVDQYIYQWDNELGPPWKNKELYDKVSYPFWHADRIRTPTLFLGGANDDNVPIVGGEQMYQALRSLGVDTQLIVYPNTNHGITIPSYQKDRLERYVAWYGKYLRAVQP
jgi:dipeptidyl aminopeptidase/acylaminoacyl peptidase